MDLIEIFGWMGCLGLPFVSRGARDVLGCNLVLLGYAAASVAAVFVQMWPMAGLNGAMFVFLMTRIYGLYRHRMRWQALAE